MAPGDSGTDSEAGEQEEGGARGELAAESRKSEQEVREGKEEVTRLRSMPGGGRFLSFCLSSALVCRTPSFLLGGEMK